MKLDFLEWERRGGRDVGAESENITHAESLKILSLTMFNMGVKTFVKGEGGISLNGLASSADARDISVPGTHRHPPGTLGVHQANSSRGPCLAICDNFWPVAPVQPLLSATFLVITQ